MKNKDYCNYFRDHYGATFSKKDILGYKKWMFSQVSFISDLCPSEKGTRVLEIGSGFGGFYNLISKKEQKKYTGLELDQDAVCFANKYFQCELFIRKSIEEFNGVGFDRVYAFEVLEHLKDPIESVKKIKEILKEKGLFVGTTPYPYKKNIVADDTHLFVLHPENWKRIFLYAGFRTVNIYPMSFFPYLWRIHKNLNIRIPLYIPLRGFISTSLIIARK